MAVFGFTGDKAVFYSIEFMTAIIPGGLGPPFCTSLCSGVGAPAGFPKEKAGRRPGVPRGFPLGASLPPFSAQRKEVASRPDLFCRACWSLSAHINRCLNEKGYPMRGHPLLLRAAKVGKNAPGGFPRPQITGRFSFYENRRQCEHLNQRLQNRGCGPGDYGGYKSYHSKPWGRSLPV